MRKKARMMLVTIISIVATPGQSANHSTVSNDYLANHATHYTQAQPVSAAYVEWYVTSYVPPYVQSILATIQSATTYTVGQHALGGTVFYVDGTGTHGLVATNNQTAGNQSWNGSDGDPSINNIRVNATGNGIGAGAINTSLMVGVQSSYVVGTGTPLINMAAQICVNYATRDDVGTPCGSPGSAGEPCYANWYLPSKYELYQLYLQRSVLGSRTDDFIWSSTEVDDLNATRINFGDGSEPSVEKSAVCGVWCIHPF